MIAGSLILPKQTEINSWRNFVEKIFHSQKLRLRANKYRFKEDKGGIKYILENVKYGDTVFDIGAHKGGYLYFLKRAVGEKGTVHAFEPQSILFKYLQKLNTLFHWNNVSIHPMAVSENSGHAVLSIPFNKGKRSSPCATILEYETSFPINYRENVVTITLDEYCLQRGLKPDLLKVDVEGNELSVFKGSEYILSNYHPKIVFESESRFVGEARVKETFQFLLNLGYTGFFIQDNNKLPIEKFHFGLQKNNSGGVYCNNFIFE